MLGRAVFQSSERLGEVFRGSCGARKRSARTSCSPLFRLASAFRVLHSLNLRFSLFLPRYSLSRSFSFYFRLPACSAATRHMDAHEERLLRRTRKRFSRFASLVKRTRDFAYRTPSRLFLSFSLSLVIILSSLFFDFVPSLFAFAMCYSSRLFLSFGDTHIVRPWGS